MGGTKSIKRSLRCRHGSTMPNDRQPRMPVRSLAWKSPESSMNRPRRRWPMDWTRTITNRKSRPSISVLELNNDDGTMVFEVISTSGDTHLGGDDFDEALINYVADQFKQDNGMDLRQDQMALQRLQEACEKAKKELSTVPQTEINLPFIAAEGGVPKHLQVNITRAKFEELTDGLIERCRGPVMQALSDAKLNPGDINEVVLVGGSTRIPKVQQLVKDIFNKEPHRGVNPDEVVAVGAAIQGAVLTGDRKDVLLLDVTPLTLGIETEGGVLTALVERNTTIPTERKKKKS